MKVYIHDHKIHTDDNLAYVDLGHGQLLCIGRADEVDNASLEKICDLIEFALAMCQYNLLTPKGQKLH